MTEVDFIIQSAWNTFGKPTAGPVTGGGGSGGVTPTPGGGSGTGGGSGWPWMNTPVQAYIDQANAEITEIFKKDKRSANLNVAYNAAGTQLMREQRARYIAIPAVPSPVRSPKLNAYPMTIISYVDSIPVLSQDTRPNMYGQTIEAISDLSLTGGQSQTGLAREARNEARLQLLGTGLDNNIPGGLNSETTKALISNGTVSNVSNGMNTSGDTNAIIPPLTPPGYPGPGGTSGDGPTILPNPSPTPTPGPGGTGGTGGGGSGGVGGPAGGTGSGGGGSGGTSVPDGYTQPGILVNTNPTSTSPGDVITPEPPGYYDPNTGIYTTTTGSTGVFEVSPIQEILNAAGANTVAARIAAGEAAAATFAATAGRPVVTAGPRLPYNNSKQLDFGGSISGTLSGSQYTNLVPDNLRWPYIAGSLTSATYSVDEAINEVIKCNCDCWID